MIKHIRLHEGLSTPIGHPLRGELPALTYLKAAYHLKGSVVDPNDDKKYSIKGKLRKTVRLFLKAPEKFIRPFVLDRSKKIKIKNREIDVRVGRLKGTINYSKLARTCKLSRTAVRRHIKNGVIIGVAVISREEEIEYYKKHPYSKSGPGRYFRKRGSKDFIFEELVHEPREITKAQKQIKKTADEDFFTNESPVNDKH